MPSQENTRRTLEDALAFLFLLCRLRDTFPKEASKAIFFLLLVSSPLFFSFCFFFFSFFFFVLSTTHTDKREREREREREFSFCFFSFFFLSLGRTEASKGRKENLQKGQNSKELSPLFLFFLFLLFTFSTTVKCQPRERV